MNDYHVPFPKDVYAMNVKLTDGRYGLPRGAG